MLSEEDKQTFGALKEDLYQMLVSAWCYKQKLSGLPRRLRTETRMFLLEELTSVRLMGNDIILRICKLDDEHSKFGFHAVRKHVFKAYHLDEKAKDSINAGMKGFREIINRLKVDHRNAYIAHLNDEQSMDPFVFIDLTDHLIRPIGSALQVTELLWGGRLEFRFRFGSVEGETDFRRELGV